MFLWNTLKNITLGIFLIFGFIFTFSCQTHSPQETPPNISNWSADSIISWTNTLNTNQWAQEIGKLIGSQSGPKNSRKKDSLITYLFQRGKKENNPYALNIAYFFKGYTFLEIGQIDSAENYAHQSLKITESIDTINPLNTYHLLGLCAYFKNKTDLALHYWQKGYEVSEIRKDEKFVGLFATNLGTTYYYLGNSHTARKLFLRGIEAKFRTQEKKGVLINNLISTLIDDNKFLEADSFWNKYQHEITPNATTYEGQLFLINRVNLLLMLDSVSEAQNLLNTLSIEQVHPALNKDYSRVFIHTQICQKKYEWLSEEPWKTFAVAHASFLGSSLKHELLKQRNEPALKPFFVTLKHQGTWDTFHHKLSERETMNTYELIGMYGVSQSDPSASYYLQKALELQRSIHYKQFESNLKITKEFKQIERIVKEIQQKEAIIEKDKILRIYLWIAIGLLVIIALLIIWVFYKNTKIKEFEKRQLEAEQLALKKEQELNNRTVEYSKIIIENNQKLKDNLNRLLPMVDDKAKSEIRQMLNGAESLNTLNTNENPTLANQLIAEDAKWSEKYPGFNELNKTEQRVFVLVQESYKAKEIATLLGVATQYVRNVKTRLRKKLELPEDWGA
jgi:hypothetical protein